MIRAWFSPTDAEHAPQGIQVTLLFLSLVLFEQLTVARVAIVEFPDLHRDVSCRRCASFFLLVPALRGPRAGSARLLFCLSTYVGRV